MENIKTDRLILRKPQQSDASLLFPLLNDKLLEIYIPHLYSPNSNDIRDFLYYSCTLCDYQTDFCFIIEELKSKDIVGIIEAYILSNNTISISYAVKESARGKGYMPESLQALLQYFKDNTNAYAAEFSIRYDNYSSINVMKKLGIPFNKDTETYIYFRLPLKEKLH